MIVVSDTTAITTLIKAGESGLLKESFGEIIVPQAVWDELKEFHGSLPDFISLRQIAGSVEAMRRTETIGRGEAEAILLAGEAKADILLMDDRKGRRAAMKFGLQCTALIALVVKARQEGKISSVRDFIETLEKRGGLYLSDAVKAEALKLAGESM